MHKGSGNFVAHGTFTANARGLIDTAKTPSETGTYEGVEPYGLLWSLKPLTGERRGSRLLPRDTRSPLQFATLEKNGNLWFSLGFKIKLALFLTLSVHFPTAAGAFTRKRAS